MAIKNNGDLKSLAERLKIPYLDKIKDGGVDPSIVSKIPMSFLKKYKLMPVSKRDNILMIAVADPLNLYPVDDIRLLTGLEVEVAICEEEEIIKAINRYHHLEAESPASMIEDLTEEVLEETLAIREEEWLDDLLDIANKAPIIKLVNLILFQAVKDRASDIHIEPFEKTVRVRYRIDGILYDTLSPPKKFHHAIVSRIKVMSHLNIAERRLPQDGRTSVKIGDKEFDIRISIVPTAFGERVVLRLLDKSSILLGLEELGLSKERLDKFNAAIGHTHGIILVTGPTGSGKTTTLYAALSRLNSPDKNIITVEDPVEYQLPGVGQIQVQPKIGLTFANGLRSILRQDPNIMMVGEIRDMETAEIAIHASLTGHLVFSTLHTNDSAGAITRLLDMGIEPYLASSSLIAIMAQRLVRTVCAGCKESYNPEEESLREIGIDPSRVQIKELYQGKGCNLCLNTGYRGRTGIYEMLLMDQDIRNLVLNRADSNTIKKKAQEKGMITLREDGARKILDGITTIEEVLRVTQEDIE
ncbi:MAG: type II secretion system ATPase GspE [Candidatus Omnitrophica bacterium]|nr:type II secretion system ATPase GspE [Candidatus Omnitrophota bacterium]